MRVLGYFVTFWHRSLLDIYPLYYVSHVLLLPWISLKNPLSTSSIPLRPRRRQCFGISGPRSRLKSPHLYSTRKFGRSRCIMQAGVFRCDGCFYQIRDFLRCCLSAKVYCNARWYFITASVISRRQFALLARDGGANQKRNVDRLPFCTFIFHISLFLIF